jgi:hypothetical protein
MSQTSLGLLLRNRPDVARGVRNLVRKTPDRVLHYRHLLLQASKSVIARGASRFSFPFSVGWKVSCHTFLQDTTVVSNVSLAGRFRSRSIQ